MKKEDKCGNITDEKPKQRIADKYFLGLDISKQVEDLEKPKTAKEAAKNGALFYSKIQIEETGHWGNDYGGPMFLLPGLVFACYISNTRLSEEQRIEMVRYLTNEQNEDGGWGLHIEGKSTMFGSCLNYVTLRILGVEAEDKRCVKGRDFILKNKGALGIPSWGKFWLATMGLYEWEGLIPLLPELWYLPYWTPIFPGRLWCHARMVYLPMSYIFGMKGTCPKTKLILDLRKELYIEDYNSINWENGYKIVSKLDYWKKHTFILDIANCNFFFLKINKKFKHKNKKKGFNFIMKKFIVLKFVN